VLFCLENTVGVGLLVFPLLLYNIESVELDHLFLEELGLLGFVCSDKLDRLLSWQELEDDHQFADFFFDELETVRLIV